MSKRATFLTGLTLALVSAFVGCGGPSVGTVSGKVKVKGKPVYFGFINLLAANGDVFPGGIDDQGNYTVLNVPSGVLKVGVISEKPTGPPPSAIKFDPANPPPPPPTTTGPPPQWVAVNAKYADPKTSGKEITVKAGSNTIDIELE